MKNRPQSRQAPVAPPQRAHYKIICGEALEVLKSLPAGSVDMCMTSPPYWGHREYDTTGIGLEETHAEYVINLCRILDEVKRVLKPCGSLWLNIGDSYEAKHLVGVPWRVALHLIDHGCVHAPNLRRDDFVLEK
jgi:site-specific DNA-methyltransferase (adenine-specific)